MPKQKVEGSTYGRVQWGVLWSAAAVYAVLRPVYRAPAGGRTVRSTGGTVCSTGGRDQRGPDLCDWDPLCHDVGDRAARSLRGARPAPAAAS